MRRLLALLPSGHPRRDRPRRSLAPAPALDALEARLVLSHVAPVHALGAAAARQRAAQAAAPNVGLSPPVYTLRSELNVTVGRTPGVAVGPVTQVSEGVYAINVTVQSRPRAVALASVLAPTIAFGNESVRVNVIGPGGNRVAPVVPTSPQQAAAQETTAFAGNRLFKNAVVAQASPLSPPSVFPVFQPTVVQFYDDNLADLSRNTNLVAAQAFADVLDPRPGGIFVNPSTADLTPDDGLPVSSPLPRGPRAGWPGHR